MYDKALSHMLPKQSNVRAYKLAIDGIYEGKSASRSRSNGLTAANWVSKI